MTTLVVVLLLSFLVETLTEFVFGDLFNNVLVLAKHKWTIKYITVIIGIAGSWVYGFDLVSMLGQYLGIGVDVTPFGITLTGIAIGKGSNYIHQLISEFFPAK